MADSRRETLVAAVDALLDGGGKPAGLTVARGRYRALDDALLPHSSIFIFEEIPEEGDDLAISNLLQVVVATRVKGTTSASGDESLDPFLVWNVQAILADNTLGGLCVRARLIRTSWDLDELSEPYASAGQIFEIEFTTTEADPTAGLE